MKRSDLNRCVAIGLCFLFLGSLVVGETVPSDGPRTDHFVAFARLYGYIRFFHPSDEAGRIDWDAFAVHGARRVAETRTEEELRETLAALFAPIAPTLRIYKNADPPPMPLEQEQSGRVLVAWQHRGVGLNEQTLYKSVRLNRLEDPMEPTNAAARYIDGEDYDGREFRLSARVRASPAGARSGGRLFIQAMNQRFETYLDEDLRDRLVTDPTWQRVVLEGSFDEPTRFITYGVGLAGLGVACFDDVRLEVTDPNGEWFDLEVDNGGFEEIGGGVPRNWDFDGYGYRFFANDRDAASGDWASCIRSTEGYIPGSLFSGLPEPEDEIDKPLAGGLRARFPAALWLEPEAPDEVGRALADLLETLALIERGGLSSEDLEVRVAAVAIAWNVLQHFYPYFDVVEADWPATLRSSLDKALADTGPREFLATLRQLVADLQDGHGTVFHRELQDARLDVELSWIEGQMVVLDSREVEGLERGDAIRAIDGQAAEDELFQRESAVSGSPQWRRFQALGQLSPGPPGSPVQLQVSRAGESFELEIVRSFPKLRDEVDASLKEVAAGVWLVDLSRATMAEIEAMLPELAKATGVVFDLRGYPKSNHDVLRHLTDQPLRSAKWNVPLHIYPDRERLAGYNTGGRWTLDPKPPRFRGRFVFLTDGRAISYAESVLGIVEHYELAEIVGEPTAGANGNINFVELPGGYRLIFTGMRVLKHNDSQHHLVGILPTVPTTRTLTGVREGRDELLEKAIELVMRETNE